MPAALPMPVGRGWAAPSGAVAEGGVELADQLADAAAAVGCDGVAAEHVDDGGGGSACCLRDVGGADTAVIACGELGGPRRVGGRPEDVPDLRRRGNGCR